MAFDNDDPQAALRDELNHGCFCIDVSRDAFWDLVAGKIGADASAMRESRPHLVSPSPAFVTRRDVARMEAVLQAVEAAAALPGFQTAALADAPAIARPDYGTRGVMMGYDFHLGDDGPRLIEVNTNAGGAFLCALAAQAQVACCPEVQALTGEAPAAGFEAAVMAMIEDEWRAQGRDGLPARLVIVDDAPEAQFLYPEFRVAQALLRTHGVRADIAAPEALTFDGGVLRLDGEAVDFVYNRLTDFALAAPRLAPLAQAYAAGAVVLSPSPRHHALLADKRNLVRLSDLAHLADLGLAAAHLEALEAIPQTVAVTADNAAELWTRRDGLFFKPAGGHAGKRVYRGDKLTRRVWDEITAADDYIAQAYCPLSVRDVQLDGAAEPRKMDVRLYTYAGRTLLAAARLYAGQTTNFRTPGGGFSPVIVLG